MINVSVLEILGHIVTKCNLKSVWATKFVEKIFTGDPILGEKWSMFSNFKSISFINQVKSSKHYIELHKNCNIFSRWTLPLLFKDRSGLALLSSDQDVPDRDGFGPKRSGI